MLAKFEAFQIAKVYHQQCKRLKVPRYLQDQFLRASSSIALNLAEGSGKRTPKDQRRFYTIAFGSFRECQAIREIEKLQDEHLDKLEDQLGAILYTLSRKSIQRKPQTVPQTTTDTDTAADD